MSDCYCDYDYDPPSFYCAVVRKARKEHRCEECSGPILPAEQYENAAIGHDGSVSNARTCERCRDLRQWVQNNVPCFCWLHGSMLDDAEGAVNEAAFRAPDETVGLRFGFKRRLHMISLHNRRQRRQVG